MDKGSKVIKRLDVRSDRPGHRSLSSIQSFVLGQLVNWKLHPSDRDVGIGVFPSPHERGLETWRIGINQAVRTIHLKVLFGNAVTTYPDPRPRAPQALRLILGVESMVELSLRVDCAVM